jgi:hypothetical protein
MQLQVVPLPPGENPLAVKINNNKKNNMPLRITCSAYIHLLDNPSNTCWGIQTLKQLTSCIYG